LRKSALAPGAAVPALAGGELPSLAATDRTSAPANSGCGILCGLDDALLQRQAGQVRAASASALVADPVQMRADGAHGDKELFSYLGVGMTLCDQGCRRTAQCWPGR